MITLAQLSGAHRRTYQKITRAPRPTETVRRVSVRSLLAALGQVTPIGHNRLEVVRNGHVLALASLGLNQKEPATELLAIRKYLKRSECGEPNTNGREPHLLLVFGHHEARLYRCEVYGGFPVQIHPSAGTRFIALTGTGRRNDGAVDRFFEFIAQALRSTDRMFIVGESNTSLPEMDAFIAWLKRKHTDLAERISGSMVLHQRQPDVGLLLTKSRQLFVHSDTA